MQEKDSVGPLSPEIDVTAESLRCVFGSDQIIVSKKMFGAILMICNI
jgi:hypothetical protein